jgi:hypothetical protein
VSNSINVKAARATRRRFTFDFVYEVFMAGFSFVIGITQQGESVGAPGL